MRLDINTTYSKVFRQVVEVIRSIPPLNKLRNRELDVLAVLMYYNFKYKDVNEDIRWRIINDSYTKEEMRKEIDMSVGVFNNNISVLRKFSIVNKEGKIPSFLMIDMDNKFEVKFNFKINIEEDGLR